MILKILQFLFQNKIKNSAIFILNKNNFKNPAIFIANEIFFKKSCNSYFK